MILPFEALHITSKKMFHSFIHGCMCLVMKVTLRMKYTQYLKYCTLFAICISYRTQSSRIITIKLCHWYCVKILSTLQEWSFVFFSSSHKTAFKHAWVKCALWRSNKRLISQSFSSVVSYTLNKNKNNLNVCKFSCSC